MSDLAETADVIVGGGGSAGAVLAARLSQDPARKILLGGHVIATGHSADEDFARDLGPEQFIIAGAGDPGGALGVLDVIIDTVGGAVLQASYGLMREGGRLVTLGAPLNQERARRHKAHAMLFVLAQDPRALAGLAEMTDAGRLRPVVSQTFPLAQGRQACESGGHPRPPGKTIVVVR
jgi:NADPH:quinone reductase-like Zn-dependent oxidoreductase